MADVEKMPDIENDLQVICNIGKKLDETMKIVKLKNVHLGIMSRRI